MKMTEMFTQGMTVFINGIQLSSITYVSRERDGIHVEAFYVPGDVAGECMLDSIQSGESVNVSVVFPLELGRWNVRGKVQGRAILPIEDLARLKFDVTGTVAFVESAPGD